nr:YraN family protein [Tomitella gaofuii]
MHRAQAWGSTQTLVTGKAPGIGGAVWHTPAPGAAAWTTRELGDFGEDVAAAYLEEDAMTVLERNWRCREGELDIVAMDGDAVVFVEVKTRRGEGFGAPAEAVTVAKARRLRRLAARWLSEQAWSVDEVRLDVVGVVVTDDTAYVEHYQGAL